MKQVTVSSQQKQPALDPANLSLKLGALAVNAIRNELDRIDKELEKTPAPGSSSYMAGMAGSGGYGGESGYGGPGSSMGMGMPGMSMGMGCPEWAWACREWVWACQEWNRACPGKQDLPNPATWAVMAAWRHGGIGGMSSMAPGEDAKVDLSRRRFKGFIASVQSGLDGMKKLATADPAKSTVKEVGDRLNEILKATDPPEAPEKPAPAAAPGSGCLGRNDAGLRDGVGGHGSDGLHGCRETKTLAKAVVEGRGRALAAN